MEMQCLMGITAHQNSTGHIAPKTRYSVNYMQNNTCMGHMFVWMWNGVPLCKGCSLPVANGDRHGKQGLQLSYSISKNGNLTFI